MKHLFNAKSRPKIVVLSLFVAAIIIPSFIVYAMKDTTTQPIVTKKVMPMTPNNGQLPQSDQSTSSPTSMPSATPDMKTDIQGTTNQAIDTTTTKDIQSTDSLDAKTHTTKRVALTFDDGPHPVVTARILKKLDKYNAKATFFVIGKNVKSYPKTIKETFEQGHEIGNHTYLHKKLTTLTTKQILQEYNKTNWVVFKTTGQNPTAFRPPYGNKNARVTSTIPLPMTMWTIDTRDWQHKDAEKIVSITKKSLHNNAIILMHDIHPSTADGLDKLLAYLQKEDYEFVTVSELQEIQKSSTSP